MSEVSGDEGLSTGAQCPVRGEGEKGEQRMKSKRW